MANIILSEEEYNELKKSHDSWRDRYYEIRCALRKDAQLDESISSTDIPSDVEMIEDLKKRAADSDYYKEKSELLEEKLKKANELADSWKRDYERIRELFLCPIFDILYPDNPNLDINVTDLLNTIKDFKVCADENESMYADLKYWKERCHKAETDVTILNSKVETLKNKNDKYLKKIVDQQATHYKQCARILDLENMVSKLQSGEYDDILAKDIEIKSLQDKYEAAMTGWKDAIDTNDKSQSEIENLTKAVGELQSDIATLNSKIKELNKNSTYYNRYKTFSALADAIVEKNTKLNQTISDQEVTIKALLITIKEMCKEENENA